MDEKCYENINARLSTVETTVKSLQRDHKALTSAIDENTALTQTIADNTNELVDLLKTVKGIRSFTVWIAPVVASVIALIAYIKGMK